MASPVEMVHRHLEYLKYVGGTREQCDENGKKKVAPSGQGLEVEIVVLPDLLLDVLRYNFKEDKPVFAVGGRAARMACALLHLLGEDDGTYQVYLLTKTGNLGQLLLENEFCVGTRRRSFSNPFLDYAVIRDGQPRCAIRGSPHNPVESSLLTGNGELGPRDIDKPGIRQLIERARAICLTSVNTPYFHGLFDRLLGYAPEDSVFVDSRTSKEPLFAMRGLLRHLRRTKKKDKKQLNKIAALFVRYDQESTFCEAAGKERSLRSVCDELQTSVVRYGGDDIQLWTPKFTPLTIAIPPSLDVRREGVSEYFKAGVVLAWSTWRTVSALKDSHPGLYTRLIHEWTVDPEGENCWPVVLQYGIDLAMTRCATGSLACTFDDVLAYVRGNEDKEYGSAHLPDRAAPFDPKQLLLKTEAPTGEPRRRLLIDNEAASSAVAELAGRRRVSARRTGSSGKKGMNALHCPTLALCDLLVCTDGRPCPKVKQEGPAAAVMIDLDSTLMDSTEQRDRGLTRALAQLKDGRPLSDRIEFFTKSVYRQNDLFQAAIPSFPDVRQKWNHPAWYITYLMFARDDDLKDETSRWSPEGIAKAKNASPDAEDRRRFDEWLRKFKAVYQRVETEEKESISAAMAAFESVQLYPFKEARDFLESLRLTGSFELYIVSEGDPDTQWMKLRRTGLTRFFDREHVLTTGDAVQTVEVLQALQKERERLAIEETDTVAYRARLKEFVDRQSEMATQMVQAVVSIDCNAEVAKVITDTEGSRKVELSRRICRLNGKWEEVKRRLEVVDFVMRLIKREEKKSYLYAGAVRAILRNPASPRSQLRHFEMLMEPLSPKTKLKFAMVGDRQTKDMQPPSDLLGEKIVTIRLHSLGYAIDPKELVADRSAARPPRRLADTLAQAKAILLNKETWASTRCASDPPLFNCKVEVSPERRDYYPRSNDEEVSSIGLNYIECGCRMSGDDFKMTRWVCAGILVEHLAKSSEDDRDAALGRYLSPSTVQRSSVRERAALLCSLVLAGMLSQNVLDRFQVKLVKVLADAVEQIRQATRPSRNGRRLSRDLELEGGIRTSLGRVVEDGVREARNDARRTLSRYWGM